VKKRSVGLILVTKIPAEDGSMKCVAVLHRRGIWNFEDPSGVKRESYPGCSQVTVHGGLKDDESFLDGLDREVGEEIGKDFGNIFDLDLLELTHINNEKKEIITYCALVEMERIRKIRLAPESGGLDFIDGMQINGQFDSPTVIEDSFKKVGCPPSIRAMFPDEIKAVREALIFADGRPWPYKT
jgi:hypothetical protein